MSLTGWQHESKIKKKLKQERAFHFFTSRNCFLIFSCPSRSRPTLFTLCSSLKPQEVMMLSLKMMKKTPLKSNNITYYSEQITFISIFLFQFNGVAIENQLGWFWREGTRLVLRPTLRSTLFVCAAVHNIMTSAFPLHILNLWWQSDICQKKWGSFWFLLENLCNSLTVEVFRVFHSMRRSALRSVILQVLQPTCFWTFGLLKHVTCHRGTLSIV